MEENTSETMTCTSITDAISSELVDGDDNNELIKSVLRATAGALEGDADAIDEYLDTFPVGYRFAPRDDELIESYLHNRIHNRPLPINNITEVDIYKYNPEELVAMYHGDKNDDEKDHYFFTPRDRKYPNGSRPNRKAGDGYWKATGADKDIKHLDTEDIVGFKKALVFYKGKAGDGDKTNWIMHEYRLPEPAPRTRQGIQDMRLDDWILVRIYEKKSDDPSKANKEKIVVANNQNEEDGAQPNNVIPPLIDDDDVSPESSITSELAPEPQPQPGVYYDEEGRDEIMALLSGDTGIDNGPNQLYLQNHFPSWNGNGNGNGNGMYPGPDHQLAVPPPIGVDYYGNNNIIMNDANYYFSSQIVSDVRGNYYGFKLQEEVYMNNTNNYFGAQDNPDAMIGGQDNRVAGACKRKREKLAQAATCTW